MYTEYNRLPEKCNNPDEQAHASSKGMKHYPIRAGQAARLLAEAEQNAGLDSQQKGVLPENSLYHKIVRGRLHLLLFHRQGEWSAAEVDPGRQMRIPLKPDTKEKASPVNWLL